MNRCILSECASNTATEAVLRMLDNGYLDLFAGDQPSKCDAPVDGRDHLARVAIGSPAFGDPELGFANARKSWESEPARMAGNAEWFRACTRDGEPVFDGSVGTSGCDLNLNDVSIKAGTIVLVRGFRFGVSGR